MLTSTKIREQKIFFLNIFENYLLKVMSMQSFRFIRLVDKKLTFGEWGGGGVGGSWERRAHLEKPTNMKKLMKNGAK